MKNIKLKLLSFFVCFLMCFSLVGCNKNNNNNNNNNNGNGGGTGDGGNSDIVYEMFVPTNAEEAFKLIKYSFLNKKEFKAHIALKSAEGETLSYSRSEVKIGSDYLYINNIRDMIDNMRTYEKSGDKYLEKLYNPESKTYIVNGEISAESYEWILFSNFAVLDWNEYYNENLKGEGTTITFAENDGIYTVTVVREYLSDEGGNAKQKYIFTIENNVLSTVLIENCDASGETETLINFTIVAFDYENPEDEMNYYEKIKFNKSEFTEAVKEEGSEE